MRTGNGRLNNVILNSGNAVKNRFFRDSSTGLFREFGVNSSRGSRDEDGRGSVPTYQDHLLNLRAALSEKELQLRELQAQHNCLINRSSAARQTWEEAINAKDHLIQQLQRDLEVKACAIKRQEKLIEDTKQRFFLKRKTEKTDIEKKDLEIALLKAKNAQQAEELVEHRKFCAVLKSQQEKKENQLASYSQHLKRKVEKLNEQVQDLEGSLQNKEKDLEIQKKCCSNLKIQVWKKECMVTELQFEEQHLQSTLTRQIAAYEALECVKNDLQEEKAQTEKAMAELTKEVQTLEAALWEENRLKENLELQEACLQRQQRQLRELQRSLSATEEALNAKILELQNAHKENQMISQEYDHLKKDFDVLKHEYEFLKEENAQLQVKLMKLEEQIDANQWGMNKKKVSHGVSFYSDGIVQQKCFYKGAVGTAERSASAGEQFHKPYTRSHDNMYPTQAKGFSERISRLGMPLFERDNSSCPSQDRCPETGVDLNEILSREAEPAKECVALKPKLAQKSSDDSDAKPSNLQETCLETSYVITLEKNKINAVPTAESWKLPLSRGYLPPKQSTCLFEDKDKAKTSVDHNLTLQKPLPEGLYNVKSIETKFSSKKSEDDICSNSSQELQTIQEEILKRERSWKHTEAKMRAELGRRLTQIQEAEKDFHPLAAKDEGILKALM